MPGLSRRHVMPRKGKLFSRTRPPITPLGFSHPTFLPLSSLLFYTPQSIMFKLARGRPIAAAFRAATVSSSRCRTLGPYPGCVDGLLMRRMLSRSPPSSPVWPSSRSVTCPSTNTCPPVSSSRYVNRVPILPRSQDSVLLFDQARSLIRYTVWHWCSQGRGRSLP